MVGQRSPAEDSTSEQPAEQSAQEDLQAAVAADVVERAPDQRARRPADRRGSRAVRAAREWTTSFGGPEVPEVGITHSVASDLGVAAPAGTAAAAGRSGTIGRCRSREIRRVAVGDDRVDRRRRPAPTRDGRARGRAGRSRCGRASRRDRSWPAPAATGRPCDQQHAAAGEAPATAAPRLVPARSRSARADRVRRASVDGAAGRGRRPHSAAAAGDVVMGGILVEPDEVAERHREIDVVRGRERIVAELVLQPRHQDGEAQRIEARIRAAPDRRSAAPLTSCPARPRPSSISARIVNRNRHLTWSYLFACKAKLAYAETVNKLRYADGE